MSSEDLFHRFLEKKAKQAGTRIKEKYYTWQEEKEEEKFLPEFLDIFYFDTYMSSDKIVIPRARAKELEDRIKRLEEENKKLKEKIDLLKAVVIGLTVILLVILLFA